MQTITDKLVIEKLLTRLTTYIANKLHLSVMAAVGAVCMSKVANELAGGKIPEGTSFDELSERLFKEVTMAL
jgi:hypothetical protein